MNDISKNFHLSIWITDFIFANFGERYLIIDGNHIWILNFIEGAGKYLLKNGKLNNKSNDNLPLVKINC